jgi:hypothetical protein
MATQAGVWIDYKQAIVVLLGKAGKDVKKIAFDIGQPTPRTSSSGRRSKFTPNDFVAEDKLERKTEMDRKNYYDDVIDLLRGADAVLVLGPGQAKGDFLKRIQSKKLLRDSVEIKTAGKMTDGQLAAKVAEHFGAAPIRKSDAPTKPGKVMKGKRGKKTKK